MDDASQTYINSRDGIPAFANWCKKEIAANDITINNVVSIHVIFIYLYFFLNVIRI